MTNFADKLVPMFVGSTKRIVGHALTYAPSPQASIGKDYGMRPSSCAGSKVTHPDLRACHGPHIGVERMIGPDDGNLTSTPMMKAWRRPFRESVGNRQGITPVGELLTEGGMLFRGYHVWLGTAMNGTSTCQCQCTHFVRETKFTVHLALQTPRCVQALEVRVPSWVCPRTAWPASTRSRIPSSARPVSRCRRLRCT